MGKSRYRPPEPPWPVTETRIDVGQQHYNGPWLVILTEPGGEKPGGIKTKLGSYSTAEEGRRHAFASGQAPPEKIFVSHPIRDHWI